MMKFWLIVIMKDNELGNKALYEKLFKHMKIILQIYLFIGIIFKKMIVVNFTNFEHVDY